MHADPARALRALLQQTLRRAGALREGATPCGHALPIAHAHALMALLAEGPMRQQALGGLLGIDKSNVARLCARMEALGHAAQRPDPRDARARQVTLTAKGRRLAGEVDARRRAGTTRCSRGSRGATRGGARRAARAERGARAGASAPGRFRR
ncbi:MAG: MarR family winged helix-turn-helix transcriptional regulator [Polyangiales bacterium]